MPISMSLISFQFRETCDGGHEHRYKTQYHPERFVGQFFLAKKKEEEKSLDQLDDTQLDPRAEARDKINLLFRSHSTSSSPGSLPFHLLRR